MKQGEECGKSCGTCGWFFPYMANMVRPQKPEPVTRRVKHLWGEEYDRVDEPDDGEVFAYELQLERIGEGICGALPKTEKVQVTRAACSLWMNSLDPRAQ